ncbi:hypothetical protein BJ508DRAFT_312872 [Ascobolus immersus RN42]|uniref:Uncharacterized protein n=1 Tax=Ascobolus immersus RN42 TaxID=1160509 RepID=A0A3N4HKQ4_ASCIM|nr:hypothetical protein BJ508DRAFT_312872 [Ascobolus immersus RN42]
MTPQLPRSRESTSGILEAVTKAAESLRSTSILIDRPLKATDLIFDLFTSPLISYSSPYATKDPKRSELEPSKPRSTLSNLPPVVAAVAAHIDGLRDVDYAPRGKAFLEAVIRFQKVHALDFEVVLVHYRKIQENNDGYAPLLRELLVEFQDFYQGLEQYWDDRTGPGAMNLDGLREGKSNDFILQTVEDWFTTPLPREMMVLSPVGCNLQPTCNNHNAGYNGHHDTTPPRYPVTTK